MSGPIYLYGVVGGGSAPALEAAPGGVPATANLRTRTIARGLHLVLADADPRAWSEAAIAAGLRDMDWVSERALRHDEVLAHCLLATSREGPPGSPGATAIEALVPMKAFTLFHSEERAVAHVLAQEPAIRAIVARVAGCVEWGVRLRFDDRAAKQAVAKASGPARPASGAAFLQRKKAMHEASKTARADAYRAARQAAERLAGIAKELAVIPQPEGAGATSLLLELALLVPHERTAELGRTSEALRADLAASAVELEINGPCAPFHFAQPPEAPAAPPRAGSRAAAPRGAGRKKAS